MLDCHRPDNRSQGCVSSHLISVFHIVQPASCLDRIVCVCVLTSQNTVQALKSMNLCSLRLLRRDKIEGSSRTLVRSLLQGVPTGSLCGNTTFNRSFRCRQFEGLQLGHIMENMEPTAVSCAFLCADVDRVIFFELCCTGPKLIDVRTVHGTMEQNRAHHMVRRNGGYGTFRGDRLLERVRDGSFICVRGSACCLLATMARVVSDW